MSASRILNALSVLIFAIMVGAFLDVAVSKFLTSDLEIGAMPGSEVFMTGVLDEPVDGAAKRSGTDERFDPNSLLTATGETGEFAIHYEDLTGSIWRARIVVPETADPGVYSFVVHGQHQPPREGADAVTLTIYKDRQAYLKSFNSLFLGLLGVKAWKVGAVLLPLGLLSLYLSHTLTGREERTMRRNGVGPIYKLQRQDKTWMVIFGLGDDHGVERGDTLLVLDENMKPVGSLVAEKVFSDHSTARVSMDNPMRPGFYVARPDAGQPVPPPGGTA